MTCILCNVNETRGKRSRCGSCEIKIRRVRVKLASIKLLGGECSVCGYNKSPYALHFHHTDPDAKEFGIARNGNTRSWERVKKELSKCVLLCANCHAEVEWDDPEVMKQALEYKGPLEL